MRRMQLTAFWLAVAMVAAVTTAADGAAQEVRVKVDGLACPFCTYNIEKRIKTLEGYREETYEASVDEGLVTFGWKEEVPFDEEAVREQIRKAGFTPGEIETTEADEKKPGVSGRAELTEDEEGPGLRIVRPEGEAVTVRPAERLDRQESFEQLKAFIKDQGKPSVTVRGERPEEGELVLHRWRPQTFSSEVVIEVEHLACPRCSTGVMRTLGEVEGVIHAEADHEVDRIRVWSDKEPAPIDRLRSAVEDAGFEVTHAHALPREEAMEAEKE